MDRVVVNKDGLEALSEELDEAARESAERAAMEARRLCPVDTGRLRASIATSQVEGGWRFGSDAPYASLVELGTARTPAQPFLRPAIDAARQPSPA